MQAFEGALLRPARPVLVAKLLIALAAGVCNVFAYAPFGLWPLQILLLAVLLRLLPAAGSVRQAALLGMAYGWGWAAAGVHWLYISMHHYGGMPAWMAALAVALLAIWLGLFAALSTGLGAWLRRRWNLSAVATLLLVIPALWALGEWLRSWIFTGFPWISSGYAHGNGPLAGFAPLAGVYGIGWLAALAAGALALLPTHRRPALLLPILLLGGWALQAVSWTDKHGEPVTVRLLQGNVPQEMKFDPDRIASTLADYEFMIRQKPADLIATPETAIPLLSTRLPENYLERLSAFARQSGSHIIVGLPMSDGPGRYANSVLGLAPGAQSLQNADYRYDKHHLVPFGEFIPPGFRWFVDMMHMPLGDFTRGAPLQPPFQVKDQWVLPNICYEDLFGEEIADQLAAGYFGDIPQATVLLNVSNIAWFGDSIALPQHLQISQMRALETGRPMLRATNTGATAVINHRGRVTAQLPPFTNGALEATVQGYAGVTPYIVLGNGLVVALALLALAIARFLSWKKARNQPEMGKNR
ncbi:MAG TPA: apolipoprotein N-acyltransferase [Oxalobacteraceae bacterium]|nr:apolipoprotein N-acyltransferase [Oxalobacteraceae bacterium]